MDDKVVENLENLQFHQDTVASDSNSPLHLIREKEIEISGRVLAAKRQADEIVADARKQAATIMASASEEAAVLAGKHDEEVRTQLEIEIKEAHARTAQDVESLKGKSPSTAPQLWRTWSAWC